MTHWGEFPQWVFLPPAFANPQIDKYSIPEATNRETGRLSVGGEAVVPVDTAIGAVQVAVPGAGTCAGLGSTPDESEASNTAETTIVIAITTWENGKAAFIRCPCIWVIPISSTNGFHLATCNTFSPKIRSQNGPLGIGGYSPTCGT